LVIEGVVKGKGTDEHTAAVIGDTVGDPLKDTSGPSLNILIKLSAIISLVFVRFFDSTGYLVPYMEKDSYKPYIDCIANAMGDSSLIAKC